MVGEDERYPDEEQGILKEQTKEERQLDMDIGEKEEDIYGDSREKLVEDDEIQPVEDAIMKGYEDAGINKCAECGILIVKEDTVVEDEINGKLHRFCSRECADKFKEKLE